MTKNGAWYTPKTNRVTMKQWGRDDLYVEFLDASSLPYGRAKELQEKYGVMDKEIPEGETVTRLLQMVIELIVDWNMTDPTTGEKIPKPTTDADFGVFPTDVLLLLLEGAVEGLDKDKAVPLKSETSPEEKQLEQLNEDQTGGEK